MCFACTRHQGLSIGFVALEVATTSAMEVATKLYKTSQMLRVCQAEASLATSLLSEIPADTWVSHVKTAHVSHKPKGDGCPLSTYKAKIVLVGQLNGNMISLRTMRLDQDSET